MKRRDILLYLIIAGVALGIIFTTAWRANLLREDDVRTSIVPLLNETAPRPFIYRTLVPQLGKSIVAITPYFIEEKGQQLLINIARWEPLKKRIRADEWEKLSVKLQKQRRYNYPILVVFGVMYGFLFLYGMTLYRLAAEIFPVQQYLPLFTAIAGLLILLPFIDAHTKVYDFPVLALSALSFLYIRQRRWHMYILIFAVACFNKETAALQSILFLMAAWEKLDRKEMWELLFWQAILWLSIIGSLHLLYSQNPGADFYLNFDQVLDGEWQKFGWNEGAVLVLIGSLILWRWDDFPLLLRQGMALVTATVAVYFIFGLPGEYRVLFDAFPVLTLMLSYALFSLPGKIRRPARLPG